MRTKLVITIFLLIGLAATFFLMHYNCNLSPAGTMIDRIVVEKSARRLLIFRQDKLIKTYRVALGHNPIGAKEEEGDMKTPEGIYRIDQRKADSAYHLALHISYPSTSDTFRAVKRGVSSGGDIEIHGLPTGHSAIGAAHRLSDWTTGCIAVTDEEIEELWRVTPVGTAIEIRP
jgi:murein L,D-transpeptidase YafK